MKRMTIFGIACACMLITGCMNSPIAFRSNVYMTQQSASTEGTITSMPTNGAASIDAPKTTTDSYKPDTNVSTNKTTDAKKSQTVEYTAE